jgi:hypothetical protein
MKSFHAWRADEMPSGVAQKAKDQVAWARAGEEPADCYWLAEFLSDERLTRSRS